jgi:hypothetical protein
MEGVKLVELTRTKKGEYLKELISLKQIVTTKISRDIDA